MNDRQKRENERNIRAKNFLFENRSDFDLNTVATLKINNLTYRVNKTQNSLQLQKFGETVARQNCLIFEDAFDELFEELRAISDFAHAMEYEIAGLDDKFRLPPDKNPRKYIAFARITAENAETFKEQFLDYGMDIDFIEILAGKIDVLEKALNNAAEPVDESVMFSDLLKNEISEANQLIESLDPIVRRVYRADLAKLAAWMRASHVERPASKISLKSSSNTLKGF